MDIYLEIDKWKTKMRVRALRKYTTSTPHEWLMIRLINPAYCDWCELNFK